MPRETYQSSKVTSPGRAARSEHRCAADLTNSGVAHNLPRSVSDCATLLALSTGGPGGVAVRRGAASSSRVVCRYCPR